MTSKIKVDNISKVSDDSNIINKCGTAINVGASGNTVTVTGNDIRSDNYKAADGGVIISQSGTAITIGASGDTVSLASGASQSGFGRSGSVDWQTGSIKTATFTAASGEGYFCNTSGGAFTVNLPASPSAGDIVAFSDYTRTFNSENLTINRNSEPIGGVAQNAVLNVNGQAITLVYVDGTEGWINVQNAEDTETGLIPAFVSASGGNTVTTSGDFKIHTFTGPGTFTVSSAGNAAGSNSVSYLVLAGGGAGGGGVGGGGGAGGFREGKASSDCYTASPLACTSGANAGLPVTAQGYPITVGGGASAPGSSVTGPSGSPSVFSTIVSTGGGGGARNSAAGPGGSGGGAYGGGGATPNTIGTGNTPPVSPPQGNPGGTPGSCSSESGGGGGGAGAVGGAGTTNPPGVNNGGVGGAGVASSITGSPVTRGGGGGGSGFAGTGGSGGSGGGGQSGPGGNAGSGQQATANSGGGGGAGNYAPGTPSAAIGGDGGSGIVIIRYKFQ